MKTLCNTFFKKWKSNYAFTNSNNNNSCNNNNSKTNNNNNSNDSKNSNNGNKSNKYLYFLTDCSNELDIFSYMDMF